MRTVKEVADLTGISIRTLQYYDEIGLLKPTKVNDVGYRFYDDCALEKLQQILFFKELDFQLKDIKKIMDTPNYSEQEIFRKQKKLLMIKRDRLNRLLELLEKLERGESNMSFKEFDMSEYIAMLEQFKVKNTGEIIKHWGGIEKFDEFIQKVKDDESNVAQLAIKQYGSVEKYTEAMKYNMEHFPELMEKYEHLKENKDEILKKNEDLYRRLTADLTKDVASDEIQQIIQDIIDDCNQTNIGVDMGEGYWNMIIENYANEKVKTFNDNKYGVGASDYIAKALKYYFNRKQK